MIPDCEREILSQDKNFNSYIRVENPLKPIVVNPYITSSLIAACNAPPIRFKLEGKDAVRFRHLLESNGELHLSGLDAGNFFFSLVAES